MRPLHNALLALTLLAGGGCRRLSPAPSAAPPEPPLNLAFVDAAPEAGIDFRLGHGGRSPLTILDTASGGCAFLDFDGDGLQDAFLVGMSRCALYRNLGAGAFRDVSRAVQLPLSGEWMGCAVGDYDGDGDPDLFLTGYRQTALLRNEAGRRFRDVTSLAGLQSTLWSTSAAFADVDQDADLDLYVGAYVKYRKGKEDLCRLGALRTACGPEMYAAERGRLYLNAGSGRFQDATSAAGLDAAGGKTWGVTFSDFDADGRPDLYLANDLVPCDLFRNLGGGRFENVGVRSGTAYDRVGGPLGAMGTSWADYNDDGRIDLCVTTYFQQPDCLFRNDGGGLFTEVSDDTGLGSPTRPYVAFGAGFLDAENDGDLDLFLANGHVRDNIQGFDPSQSYRQPLQVLVNGGDGSFADMSRRAGPTFAEPMVGRGTAFADYDEDGDVDILVVDLEGRARLLRNQSPPSARHWLKLRLVGRPPNVDAIGARVTLTSGSRRRVREVHRDGSVLSSSDPTVHFGLGASSAAERVEVRWPDGTVKNWEDVEADTLTVMRQGGQRSNSGAFARKP